MKHERNYIALILASLILGFIGCASSENSVATGCRGGIERARGGDASGALLAWRPLAYDDSQKEWLRVSTDCLKKGGLAANDAEVAVWFQEAAAAGNSDAKNQLALLYFNGVGVPRDVDVARRLLLEAKKLGNSDAAQMLDLMDAN